MKTTLVAAIVAVGSILPGAAFAQSFGVSVNLPPVEFHAHNADCRHGDVPPAPPSGVPAQTGRYELQTVQTWVPGRYEQVVIPGQCFTNQKGHHAKTACSPDRVENRWVEGYYQTTQQYVWVDYSNRYPQYHPSQYAQNYPQNYAQSYPQNYNRNQYPPSRHGGFGRHGASRRH